MKNMVKKKQIEVPKQKLDLAKTLSAIDLRDKDFYQNLSEEEQKAYIPLVLMRYVSSAANQGGLHDYYLAAVNQIVNENFWMLSKHPELLHKLFCICGIGKKQYHEWLPGPKRGNASKLEEFMSKVYPGINEIELNIFVKQNSVEDFMQLCKEFALEDKEISKLVTQYEQVKNVG